MGGGTGPGSEVTIFSKENLARLDESIRNVMRSADEIISNTKALDADRNRYFEIGRLVTDLDRDYEIAINKLLEKYGTQIQNINKLVKTKMK